MNDESPSNTDNGDKAAAAAPEIGIESEIESESDSPAARLCESFRRAARTVLYPAVAKRESPAAQTPEFDLSEDERRRAARLMRVNHAGEVCAQALYQGQAVFARDPQTRAAMREAAEEEIDHLSWTAERIEQLGGRLSFLNPLWFGGAFAIGAAAAVLSDKISLGFVAETERQVGAHLRGHLSQLPPDDEKSRAIVKQMEIDETAHATAAIEQGGVELPPPAKTAMRLAAKIMTSATHWV